MSFTISKKIVPVKTYSEFSVGIEQESEIVNVTFTAVGLTFMSLIDGVYKSGARYDVTIDGTQGSGNYYHEFEYTGEGSPLEQAEKSLEKALRQTPQQ
ncbi:hypothetical protein [Serratia fonticola]|uniref:hypothetical protein n=1 Tax=Serratia fonticola TaxID=47917 RepID=UPI003AB030CC|nr:hypothetical protein [Serratia fonticola]